MELGIHLTTLLLGVVIFLARVGDVSLGTLRTIAIVQGRAKTAFFLGFVEVSLWLGVIATVLQEVMTRPALALFYAFGFSTGNLVGVKLEKRLAFGHIVLRVICPRLGTEMAQKIREKGFAVTTFSGEGMSGPVKELYIVCRRRDLKTLLPIVRTLVPDAFFITEQAGMVSKIYRPIMAPVTGWRAILKKK